MYIVAVTQRVDLAPLPGGGAERRDALHQAWPRFLAAAGCLPVPLPNHLDVAEAMMQELPIDGLLLTGGNDLSAHGGDAPERDELEAHLLARARQWRIPVIGVCRGMQVIQTAFGVDLEPIEGHVTPAQAIEIEGAPATVDSYHRWGARHSPADLEVWARAPDGVVKAVRHRTDPVIGVMWHPERSEPFASADLALFQRMFGQDGARVR